MLRSASRLALSFALIAATATTAALAPAARATSDRVAGCIARPVLTGDEAYRYEHGCSGHDEPEIDPLSDLPGSAQDLTWTVVLPSDQKYEVSDTGPTFWFGGPVNDPRSDFGQAFVELQFYPDALVTKCTGGGGFQLVHAPNTYTACSPVWSVRNGAEPAAFNAMLTDGNSSSPLVMHAGETITVRFFVTPAKDGWHIRVTDVATRHSGTIILNDHTDGPLMPTFSVQKIGNSLAWGIVHDAPASFVWEIGHTSSFASPQPDQYCTPGDPNTARDSYDAAHWAGTLPVQIKSVTFADGSTSKSWAVVSDYGGKAEVNQYCPSYGGVVLHLPVVFVEPSGGVALRRGLPRHGEGIRTSRPVPQDHQVWRTLRTRLDVLRHGHHAMTETCP